MEKARKAYEHWGNIALDQDPQACVDYISALEAENATLRAINANLMGDDEDKPRYTTKRLRHEIANATTALEAELAKAREALEQIAGDDEVHTAENQTRLCCKFQDIALRALQDKEAKE